MGRRARRSHPGRPRRPRRHRARHQGDPLAADGRTAACAGQQRGDLAEGPRRRPYGRDRDRRRRLDACVQRQFLCADHARARADRGAEDGEGLGGERHLDRRLPRAPVRRCGLRHLEGGARGTDPRDGLGLRSPRRARQRDRTGRDRHGDPVAGHGRADRAAHPARPPRHAGRGRTRHLRADRGDKLLRERRRDPHQRRPARRNSE